MDKSQVIKLFQMGSKGAAATDQPQVSPPASGGPSGGGKPQTGKAELNNPNQYGKPPIHGPRKGNLKTPNFEEISKAVIAVAQEKTTPEEAAVDLFFEDAAEEDDDEEESQVQPDDGGGGTQTAEKDTMEPGGGGRFEKLKKKLAKKGIKNPGGLAAKIGRQKYGKKKFQKMAAQGDATKQDPANLSEDSDNPTFTPKNVAASGSQASGGVGNAVTPTVGGPDAPDLVFTAPKSADATTMGTYEEQIRKWLDDALSQKKLWVGGIFIHKNGPNEFYLDGIASGTVSLDAAVRAVVQFSDRKLAPPGAPDLNPN